MKFYHHIMRMQFVTGTDITNSPSSLNILHLLHPSLFKPIISSKVGPSNEIIS